jgi:subtilisin family serine protease
MKKFLLVVTVLATLPVIGFNDTLKTAPSSWWMLDPEIHHVPGISTEKAYQFLQGRTSRTVVVAVIDSGIDIEHEDLRDVIWTNTDEIAGNGVDDDGNGYVDDVHGWNFLGSADGENIEFDSYELTREYVRLQEKYSVLTDTQQQADEEWEYYQKVEKEYKNTVQKMEGQFAGFKEFYDQFKKAERLMTAYLDQEELTKTDLTTWESPDEKISLARDIVLTAFDNGFDSEHLQKGYEYYNTALNYGYNQDFNPRDVIGDDSDDPYQKVYGNNDVTGDFAFHGTHVAGIIAAGRKNGIGMDGIADNVKIMVIRAVPNGDERDKDVANAIIYAVDNGAQIVNMSFGKRFSPDKEVVDKAVKYAESKGVLLIHAAGNSAHNNDEIVHYPSKNIRSTGKEVNNWIEVGAVSWKGDQDLVASFSNYGKENVDIFAPGVDILSTAPDQDYQKASGTSMAAPVTTGVAALVMSYFPSLSAEEVREIILNSTVKYQKHKVSIPGTDEEIKFGELSQTGGVVNAYEAVKMAQKSRPKGKKLLRQ